MLFNDTIEYNIRYAKPDATHEEVGGRCGLQCALSVCVLEACANGVETNWAHHGCYNASPACPLPHELPPPACQHYITSD